MSSNSKHRVDRKHSKTKHYFSKRIGTKYRLKQNFILFRLSKIMTKRDNA